MERLSRHDSNGSHAMTRNAEDHPGESVVDAESRWRQRLVRFRWGLSFTIDELVDGWRGEVGKLVRELDSSADEETAWGAYDYVGALLARERLEFGLTLLTSDEVAQAMREVSDIDDELIDMTEADVHGMLRRFILDEHDDAWWWHRIPERGPVRDEINAHNAGRHDS